jgi:arsenite methyltransferase
VPSGGAGGCRPEDPKETLHESPRTIYLPQQVMQQSGEAPSPDTSDIRNAIRSKYTEVAVSAAGKFNYPTGKEGASALGYDPAVIERAGPRFLESFCGVGNPFSLGAILPGDKVLDFGCGAGFDLFVAAGLVGTIGLVCGIDLTKEMADRARDNLFRAGVRSFEVKEVDSETIPYEDGFFDVVISNGVINLSPHKQDCFKEIHRVLKPGGRLQIADVILEKEQPSAVAGSLEAWSS